MNSKMMIAALLLAATVANAQSKGKNEKSTQDNKAATAAAGKEIKNNESTGKGQDTVTALSVGELNAKLGEAISAAAKETTVNINKNKDLVNEFMVEADKIQDKDTRNSYKALVQYIAKTGTSAANLAFLAKLFDVATRQDVGINNQTLKKLIYDFAVNLQASIKEGSSDPISSALDKTVDKERRKLILECV